MQNIQQIVKHVEVYYECLLKLTNYLQVKATNVFLTTVFKVGLLPYIRLTTIGMKRDTLIEHKEVVVVCEKNGFVSLSSNVLLTTPKANTIVKPIIHVVITKSTLTCAKCGKTGHTLETCHNKKRDVPIVPTTAVKSTKFVVETKTELAKSGRILVHYPCVIYSNVEHRMSQNN